MLDSYQLHFIFFSPIQHLSACCGWKQREVVCSRLVALKVTDLIGELPGNAPCVLAYRCQWGQGACWQRWAGSPFSCPSVIKGPEPGVERLATGLRPRPVCPQCEHFILKQDIRGLRIHPIQHGLHTFYHFYTYVNWCVWECACVYVKHLSVRACVLSLTSALCIVVFQFLFSLLMTYWCSRILYAWFEASLYWQRDSDWPVTLCCCQVARLGGLSGEFHPFNLEDAALYC